MNTTPDGTSIPRSVIIDTAASLFRRNGESAVTAFDPNDEDDNYERGVCALVDDLLGLRLTPDKTGPWFHMTYGYIMGHADGGDYAPTSEPEPEPVLGYCMADPHRNGRGKRCAHYRNEGCVDWLPEDSNDDADPDDDVTGYDYIARVVGTGPGHPYNVRLAARGILRGMGYDLIAVVNDIQKREIRSVIRHVRGVIDGAIDI